MRAAHARPATAVVFAATMIWWSSVAVAATPISLTGSSYSQSFDTMTNAAASALPTGWAFASGTVPTWTSGTLASTTQFAGTVGSGTLTASSAGGAYLFVTGTAATGTDKAIGFLSSNSFTSPRSILFGLTNDTGGTISSLDVGWTYEKYRNGTRAFDWRFFGSTDGAAWTSITAGDRNYPADATIATIPVASSTVSPLRVSGLSLAPGTAYYLRWDYVGNAGSSGAQALGIDAFSLVVSGSSPPVYGTYWDPTPGGGIGGSGTWTATSASFATTIDGTAVGLLAPTTTAVFAGTAGAVTIGGTVAAGGLEFAVDGYSLSGGTVRLAATAALAARDSVSASIGSSLIVPAGGTTTFTSGAAAAMVVTGTVAGSGTLLKTGLGELVLAADNTFSGTTVVSAGSLRLGGGDTSGSVAGPVAVSGADTAVVIDRSDDVVVATSVSGSGGLFKEGGNTVTLTGSNSFTGGLTLFAGAVVAGDGGTSGSIAASCPLDLAAGTAVIFDRSDDIAFAATIAGEGTLVQRGDGRLVLSQPGTIGSSFTLRAEAGVVDLDRGGGSLDGMLGAGNVVELAGGTLELSSASGTGTQLTGPRLVVDGVGTLAIRRTAAAGDHVTPDFACPLTLLGSGTLDFDYRGAFVGPSLPPVRYKGMTTYTGTVTLEGDATLSVTNSAGGTAEVILAGPLVTTGGSLTKVGDQALTLAGSGSVSGPTHVASGTLRLGVATVLASSTVGVADGATLAIAPGVRAAAASLAIAPAGLVDVGSGGVAVAAGLGPVELVARILEGRGDGSWTGTSGITSMAVAADVARSVPRAIGWLDDGAGGASFAYAAQGDGNIDGQVDILDAADFLAGGRFDSGLPATWNQGDFGYDGLVDILDAADFLATGLFDAGPYGTTAAVGTITAVPEPSLTAGLATLAWLVSMRCWVRIRRTSAIASGW